MARRELTRCVVASGGRGIPAPRPLRTNYTGILGYFNLEGNLLGDPDGDPEQPGGYAAAANGLMRTTVETVATSKRRQESPKRIAEICSALFPYPRPIRILMPAALSRAHAVAFAFSPLNRLH
jgi:hypothetical protein